MSEKITISDLSKVYAGSRRRDAVVALEDISVDVAVGEFLCIVGPSGCGKSTLLNILAGFESPTTGCAHINIDGNAPVPSSVVFQEHALFPWRTVFENVVFGPEMRRVHKRERTDIARDYIHLVGLSAFENKYPHELSGGMRQRVGLARALANDPEVLLMDEPFAALDAQTKMILQEELVRILDQTPKTVVYITHAIDEAVFLGDRIVVMTRAPGKVKAIYASAAGKTRSDPSLIDLQERIWESLRSELPQL